MRRLSIFVGGGVFFLSAWTILVSAQLTPAQLNMSCTRCQIRLINYGFENIQIQIGPDYSIFISYENRRYRNEMDALGIVLYQASIWFPYAQSLVIIAKVRNIPLIFVKVDRDLFLQYIHNQIPKSEFLNNITISYAPLSIKPFPGYETAQKNPSFFRLDIIPKPGFKVQFARPGDPAQLQLNLLTDFHLTLAKGTHFFGQWVFPFYNEFPNQQNQPRLGQCYLNQLIRLPYSSFLSLSGGIFENHCYGISGQFAKPLIHDRLTISATLNYLNVEQFAAILPEPSHQQNMLSYQFQATYFFDQINFRTRVTWGRYLFGDKGWRIDFSRFFNELELGFMGAWSKSLGLLTGMTVRLPFPIRKYPVPGRIRLRTPKSLLWDYRYLPCFDGYIPDTGISFSAITRQLSPGFIRANIDAIRRTCRRFQYR